MTEDSKVATVSTDAPDVTERFDVETNIVSEPEKAEPAHDVSPKPEPEAEPQEPKPINPRTLQRKAEKERLIRDNAAMAERLKQFEQVKQPEAESPKKRDLSKEPDIQDYDDVLEYSRDLSRFDRAQEVKEAEAKVIEATEQKQWDAINKRAEIVRAEKPDFDEKVTALLDSHLITPDIEKAIMASPIGADIGYHLALYGSDLMTLRGLPVESLPNAIKAIEAFIKEGGNKQDKPRVTQAQPPITPPGSTTKIDRSISSYSQEEMENMPLSEFNARFMKQ